MPIVLLMRMFAPNYKSLIQTLIFHPVKKVKSKFYRSPLKDKKFRKIQMRQKSLMMSKERFLKLKQYFKKMGRANNWKSI